MDNPKSSCRIRFISNSSSSGGPILQEMGQEAHASDIGCICIRLSSSLCCGLASHVRGEAVTQSFRTLLSLLSHQPRISTPLYLPRHFFLFSPFFSISNLPTAHSKHLHPVFATLPAFLHTITWSCAYTHFVRNACITCFK